MFRPRSLELILAACLIAAAPLYAKDLRIPIPKRSKPTPVQQLNRDGVKAVQKHDYAKAKNLFYRAYLLDPNDPFTLNNLGYVSELEGDLERAQRFYSLAAELNSDAVVDRASNPLAEGRPVSKVAGNAGDTGVEINRYNVQAIALLMKDRAPEADLVLQKALALDNRNPFTLNNLGFAREKEGEYEEALHFYNAAAATHSEEPIVVAVNRDWRGKAISEIAAENAKKLGKLMRKEEDVEARVARLNLRGVSAMNRNDHRTARQLFEQAYKLNHDDAFTLNNMAYLAELDGDRETADFYYARAKEANRNGAKVTFASRRDVEGRKIGDLADETDQMVLGRMEAARQLRERMGGPVLLRRRDNSLVIEPAEPPKPQLQTRPQPQSQELLQPLPESQQPPARGPNAPTARPPAAPQQSNPANPQAPKTPEQPDSGGLLMPLPESQQPGITKTPGAAPQSQPAPNQQSPQQPPKTSQGQNDGGLLMPLPDNQQPDNVKGNDTAQPKTGSNPNVDSSKPK